MSIKSLMIPYVEGQYTQEYIANVFWSQHIAKVSSITLIPYIKNLEICSIAYIAIDEWCDSEVAYNFIYRLKNQDKEVRIVHDDENWWSLQLNTHNSGAIDVGFYTVRFDSLYFKQYATDCLEEEEQEEDQEEEQEELQELVENRPLYCSVEEAMEHLWVLNKRYTGNGLHRESTRDSIYLN